MACPGLDSRVTWQGGWVFCFAKKMRKTWGNCWEIAGKSWKIMEIDGTWMGHGWDMDGTWMGHLGLGNWLEIMDIYRIVQGMSALKPCNWAFHMTFKHGNYEKQQLWIWCILQCCEWEVHIQNQFFFFFRDWNGFNHVTMSWRSVSQQNPWIDKGNHSIMGSQLPKLPMNIWDLPSGELT